MLETSKYILKQVSFDRFLFKKELIKAIKWLKKEDQLLLQAWCLATFGMAYKDVVLEAFNVI